MHESLESTLQNKEIVITAISNGGVWERNFAILNILFALVTLMSLVVTTYRKSRSSWISGTAFVICMVILLVTGSFTRISFANVWTVFFALLAAIGIFGTFLPEKGIR